MCRLATDEKFFQLVSVAEETVLKLSLSETPKTGFLIETVLLSTQNICLK